MSSFLDHLRSVAARAVGHPTTAPSHRQAQAPSAAPAPPSPAKPNVQHVSTSSLRALTWLGAGVTLRLDNGALEIRNPLVYSHAYPLPAAEQEPAAINLRLPIGRTSQSINDPPLGYWPRYDQLTPAQRRCYLEWLAGSRSQPPSDIGYAFLFLYGLERRALLDRQDIALIFKEVVRLRQLYENSNELLNSNFEQATALLLWCLLLRERQTLGFREFESLARPLENWNEQRLSWALAWIAQANHKLPHWIAYTLAARLPKSHKGLVAKRVKKELHQLFLKRYREAFDDGLLLKLPKQGRTFSFRPSSQTVETVAVLAYDPMGASDQFDALSDIWNACVDDLRRLSTLVAKNTDGEMTVARWHALPAELRSGIDHPLIDQFNRFIEEHTGDRPHTIVPARALATLAGVAPHTKLTAGASRRMTEVIDQVGYCIEPDPRITGRSYDDDESIILFLNLDNGAIDARRFMVAAMMLDVGLALAQADGQPAERDLLLLAEHIDAAFQLNEHEQRRLDMLRALRAEHSVELAQVAKPLRRLPQPDRERVAKLALAMVAADGVITKEELKALRRLYNAMGFDRAEADAAVAALSSAPADADAPVSVLPATRGAAGEAIPPAPKEDASPSLRLNRAAIDAILRDTADVARMLADAMNVDGEPRPAVPDVAAPVAPQPVDVGLQAPSQVAINPASLPTQYAVFYEALIKQPLWARSDLAVLAGQQGLMLAGAVDAINEWSTEINGGPLVYEEGQQFSLETEYLSEG